MQMYLFKPAMFPYLWILFAISFASAGQDVVQHLRLYKCVAHSSSVTAVRLSSTNPRPFFYSNTIHLARAL